jgi:hypothetical protein
VGNVIDSDSGSSDDDADADDDADDDCVDYGVGGGGGGGVASESVSIDDDEFVHWKRYRALRGSAGGEPGAPPQPAPPRSGGAPRGRKKVASLDTLLAYADTTNTSVCPSSRFHAIFNYLVHNKPLPQPLKETKAKDWKMAENYRLMLGGLLEEQRGVAAMNSKGAVALSRQVMAAISVTTSANATGPAEDLQEFIKEVHRTRTRLGTSAAFVKEHQTPGLRK